MCKKRTWKRERLPRVSPLIVLTMVVVSLISPWLMFSVHQTPLFILVSADSWPPSCDGVSNKQPRQGQTTETHFLSELALLDHTNNNTLYTSYTIRTLNKHASVWHLIARGLTFSKDFKCPLTAFFEHKKRPPGRHLNKNGKNPLLHKSFHSREAFILLFIWPWYGSKNCTLDPIQ